MSLDMGFVVCILVLLIAGAVMWALDVYGVCRSPRRKDPKHLPPMAPPMDWTRFHEESMRSARIGQMAKAKDDLRRELDRIERKYGPEDV